METKKAVIAYVLNHFTSAALREWVKASEIIDQGIDWRHPDFLKCNPWLGPFEKKFGVEGFEFIHCFLQEGQQRGIHYLTPSHDDYPTQLLQMSAPPLFLSMQGKPFWKQLPSLAIVGSRQPGQESVLWLEETIKQLLDGHKIGIISGGARGIDTVAHRSAIRANAPTAAVFPSGLLNLYPQAWAKSSEALLAAGGALLSEYLPRQGMKKYFFPRRNRIIAGLGFCTLVVEARQRSGTMLTAQQTLDQGKPVFVMPTHPINESGRGGLNLLCEGATPVRDYLDLSLYIAAERTLEQHASFDQQKNEKI